MSSKDSVSDAGKVIKDRIEDAKDTAREVQHRSTADAEKMRREVAGDEMTAGEKLESTANEAKNRTQAEIDKAKRNLREKTE